MKTKKLYKGMRGGGGGSIGPQSISQSPSIFKSIQPIDMKLGMCNKCSVYFQLSTCIVTWHLIGFHGKHSNTMMSLVAAILDFQIFSYLNLNTENSEKTTFSDWNLQNCKIHCKVVSI